MVDAKKVFLTLEMMGEVVRRLEETPGLIPTARAMFAPLLKGSQEARLVRRNSAPRLLDTPKVRSVRKISKAERERRSKRAKARWAAAKKAGKNTIGGGK